MTEGPAVLLVTSQLPEAGQLWIRHAPRAGKNRQAWPGPPGPWIDLATGVLAGWEASAGDLPGLDATPLDDLLYLPPVRSDLAARRDDLARAHLDRGTPVLMQLFPEDPPPPAPAVAVYDLLPMLLGASGREALEKLAKLPPASIAVWPLLPGIGDGRRLWEDACARLAEAGVAVAQAVRPRLEPADLRRLAERAGEDRFHAIFHRETPEPRAFARCAHRHGLAPLAPRPLPRPPIRLRENRRLAGLLALTAELWLRLGRPAEAGHDLYRAAREADRTPRSLADLARDGNLSVVPWLTTEARWLVEEALAGDEPRLLTDLLAEYVADDPAVP